MESLSSAAGGFVSAACGFALVAAGGFVESFARFAAAGGGAAAFSASACRVSTPAPAANSPTAHNTAMAILALVRNMALAAPAASAATCEGINPAAVSPAATRSPDRIVTLASMVGTAALLTP